MIWGHVTVQGQIKGQNHACSRFKSLLGRRFQNLRAEFVHGDSENAVLIRIQNESTHDFDLWSGLELSRGLKS